MTPVVVLTPAGVTTAQAIDPVDVAAEILTALQQQSR